MAKDQENTLRFITPKGVVSYPRLLKPDTGTKEFPQNPNFNVKIVFEAGGSFVVGKKLVPHADVVAQLEALRDAEFDKQLAEAKAKKNGKLIKLLNKVDVFADEVDGEGAETGKVSLRAKTTAEYKDKKSGELVKRGPPTMFDSTGKEIAKLPPVGGGSIMKVEVFAKPYFVAGTGAVGISKYLESTQLIKLVKFSSVKSAEQRGFESEEAGYTAEDDGDPGYDATDDSSEKTGAATSGDEF